VTLRRGADSPKRALDGAIGFWDKRHTGGTRLLIKRAELEKVVGPDISPRELAETLNGASLLLLGPQGRRRVQVLIKEFG